MLPSLQDEDAHDSVVLINHLLVPRNGLQKTPDDANLIWFTDGSYLKDEQGYYQVGYAITSRADITKGFYLPEHDLAHVPD